MGRTPAQPATYDGRTGIRIELKESIGATRFLATDQNYRTQLARRMDMPQGLRHLIEQLFLRGAITGCSISYGRRIDFTIATHNQRGHMLLVSGRLEHFQKAFADITGEQMAATWDTVSSAPDRRKSGRRADSGTVMAVLANLVDAVADGLQLAAAIKLLSSDD